MLLYASSQRGQGADLFITQAGSGGLSAMSPFDPFGPATRQ